METQKESRRSGRRAGGRAGNPRRKKSQAIKQLPWTLPRNPDRPTEPLDEEGIHAIHDGAMRVLEQIGIEFLNEESKSILKAAGCTVDPSSNNVRMDRELVMEHVRKAPAQFDITPRNPDHTITIGGDRMVFRQCLEPTQLVESGSRTPGR